MVYFGNVYENFACGSKNTFVAVGRRALSLNRLQPFKAFQTIQIGRFARCPPPYRRKRENPGEPVGEKREKKKKKPEDEYLYGSLFILSPGIRATM